VRTSDAAGPQEGSGGRLPTATKLCYGLGEFFNGTSTVIILMLFLKFLTDVVGLAPLLAGACVVSGKLWDAISDPLIGYISDRTRSRWGRRRVYFLLFSLPGSLAFVSMWFYVTWDNVWAKAAYYAGAYLLFKTLSSLLNVPYQALGPELTDDYDERTSLVAFRMAFSLAGAILAGVVPNIVVARFAAAGQAGRGQLVVALIFATVYAAIWMLLFLKLRERPPRARVARISVLPAVVLALKNRSFRILTGIYLCSFLAVDVLTASAKYYVDEYLQRPSLLAAMMGSMLTCSLLALPLYGLLSSRYDRRVAYAVGTGIWMLALAFMVLLPSDAPGFAVVAPLAVAGVGIASAFVVPWSALPEVIDIDRAVLGRQMEGIYTGFMTFLRKASTTLAIFLISLALSLSGYQAPDSLQQAAQPAEALLSIRLFTTLLPILVLVGGLFLASRYPVTKRFHALLRRRLDEPRGALSPAEAHELDELLSRGYGPGWREARG